MYKIIGTDQKEYGPVSSDQIRQWITQGRVNSQTRAQADGGEWKPLGDFPEFSALFGSGIPPLTSSAPSPVPPAAQPAKTSGLAIASLILGILGIASCGLTALIGLILGIVALSRVRKSNGALGGTGIALAGTIVSAVFLLFVVPLGLAMFLPALAKARQKALAIQCMNNVRQLALATRIYAGDHQNHFPTAQTWCDAIHSYVGDNNDRVFRCPAGEPADRCDYTFNSQLDGMDIKSVNSQTVLFFESDSGWNSSGGPERMLKTSRHGRAFAVAFVDGHCEQVTSARLPTLRWEP